MRLDERLFAETDLWIATLVIFALLAGSAEIGAVLRARLGGAGEKNDGEGYLLSAVLALLGLLIGFTFSLAVSRYDGRRVLVVNEANAIGTAWLRAGLAGDGEGPSLQQAIQRYTDVRLGLSRGADAAVVEDASGKAQAIIWAQTRAVAIKAPTPISAAIVSAVNDMFDAASSRKAEREARIPARVLDVLILYAVMSAAVVGYVMRAAGKRHRTVTLILFALLTLALTLILDLDRPRNGAILVSQQPMMDVRASMR